MPTLCRHLLAIIAAVPLALGSSAVAAPLTIEQLFDIRHPSNPVWSPDGKYIAYLWDRCDVANLYLADATGGAQPRALTHFDAGKVANIFWSPDGKSVYFVQGGKLWSVATMGGQPEA